MIYCPEEFKPLLMFLKEEGIKIEIQKELMYNIMQAKASMGNKSEFNDIKKTIIKFLFPEQKDEEEILFEKAKESLTKFGDKLRITVNKDKKLDPIEANLRLNKKS